MFIVPLMLRVHSHVAFNLSTSRPLPIKRTRHQKRTYGCSVMIILSRSALSFNVDIHLDEW